MGGRTSSRGCLPLLTYVAMLVLGTGYAHAADSLLKGGSLKVGETLVSQGGAFELGFFSPGSSSSRYLGIWYKKIPVQTVVWVANRDKPITDGSGELTIDEEGSLMLVNGRGSPFVLASSPAATALVALLLDTGNFVLADQSNRSIILWQSFDNPTDTLLPGMRIGLKGRQNRLLTSWRSIDDPSPGDFEFGLDPGRIARLSTWQMGATYWTTGIWNGQYFGNAPELSGLRSTQFLFVSSDVQLYFTYSVEEDLTNNTRFVMDVSGNVQFLAWADSIQQWAVFWSQPRGYACDCGDNGLCNNASQPTCRCLPGFEPDSSREWQAGVWSRGCVRRSKLDCGKGDGFLPLKRVKLPLTLFSSAVFNDSRLGIADCSARCKKNCSCTTFASLDKQGTGCLLWFGDLKGLQENYGDVQDLYVRLASSDLVADVPVQRSKKLLPILLPAVAASLILIACASTCCWWRSKIKDQGDEMNNQELLLLEIGPDGSQKYQDFSLLNFADVVAATGNFSDENKLGQGGFGPVYKGTFPDGQEIAVKRLSRRSTQGLEEFKTEILLIARLQHRNLVRLLGCCIKGEERMLIYEYMPNKSLDFFLFDPGRAAQLDWGMRFHIIEGIAQGLLYLHKHSRLRIIHRDLKASNILLDGELNPKISDFGLARIFSTNNSEANTNRVAGTYGYMSPEYAMEGLFSVKSDVFSFGVLLLEIVTSKRNPASFHFTGSLNLLGHAWKLWNEGRELELMDPSLGDSCPVGQVSRCIHVALMCVQDAAADRPITSDIVSMLGSENASLPAPKKPAFFIGRQMADEGIPASCSINLMTVSAIDAR